jgi:hypothetical protein
MKNAREPIIEEEKFELAQEEMKHRTIIVIVFWKGTHYSSKREKQG